MLFEFEFEIIEVLENGTRVKVYLKGKRKDVKKDIEMFKKNSKDYQMIGKNGMIVWVK